MYIFYDILDRGKNKKIHNSPTDTLEKLLVDDEIQDFAEILSRSQGEGDCGIKVTTLVLDFPYFISIYWHEIILDGEHQVWRFQLSAVLSYPNDQIR